MGQDVSGEAFRLSCRAGFNIPFPLRAGRTAGGGKQLSRDTYRSLKCGQLLKVGMGAKKR